LQKVENFLALHFKDFFSRAFLVLILFVNRGFFFVEFDSA
jgi:hypothetical protein